MIFLDFTYFISVDDIHDVDAELREEEDAVALAELLATGGTLVLLEPSIADSDAGLDLDAPVTGEDPRIAVLAAEGEEVTLQAFFLDGIVKGEGYRGVAHVEVTVDEIALEVALLEDTVFEPAAHVGLDEQMTPLLVLLLVNVPGIEPDDGTKRPKGIDFQIYTKVGGECGIVEQVVADGNRLGFHLTNTSKHQERNDAKGYFLYQSHFSNKF